MRKMFLRRNFGLNQMLFDVRGFAFIATVLESTQLDTKFSVITISVVSYYHYDVNYKLQFIVYNMSINSFKLLQLFVWAYLDDCWVQDRRHRYELNYCSLMQWTTAGRITIVNLINFSFLRLNRIRKYGGPRCDTNLWGE